VNLCTPLQCNSLWKSEKHSTLHCIYGFAYGLLSQWSHRSSHQYCMVSCLNVSLQITENFLYANTKKTEKSKWKHQVHQLDNISKLRRNIDHFYELCLMLENWRDIKVSCLVRMKFAILIGTTFTTVLHYHADCDRKWHFWGSCRPESP